MTALASPARALSQSACEGRQPSELGLPEANLAFSLSRACTAYWTTRWTVPRCR